MYNYNTKLNAKKSKEEQHIVLNGEEERNHTAFFYEICIYTTDSNSHSNFRILPGFTFRD